MFGYIKKTVSKERHIFNRKCQISTRVTFISWLPNVARACRISLITLAQQYWDDQQNRGEVSLATRCEPFRKFAGATEISHNSIGEIENKRC